MICTIYSILLVHPILLLSGALASALCRASAIAEGSSSRVFSRWPVWTECREVRAAEVLVQGESIEHAYRPKDHPTGIV